MCGDRADSGVWSGGMVLEGEGLVGAKFEGAERDAASSRIIVQGGSVEIK